MDFENGSCLGPYHILGLLGEGGMASVYKAYDPQADLYVAVKVILPYRRHSEKTLLRFKRETRVLEKLSHPNIVGIIDSGNHEGAPFLVMPFLSGGNLKQKLGRPISWLEAMQLLIPLTHALEYAHKQNVIHRDIKPSNVLLTESGRPMITDFGVAKMVEEGTTMDLTGTAAAVGTVAYMAPEQLAGKAVDHRVDIYALGVVFYEMIVGRRPYQADTPLGMMLKQATEPLPSPRKQIPSLPREVEIILLKALAKDPCNRYQTMNDFAAAMDRCLETERKKAARSAQREAQKAIRKQNAKAVWEKLKRKGPRSCLGFLLAASITALAIVSCLFFGWVAPKAWEWLIPNPSTSQPGTAAQASSGMVISPDNAGSVIQVAKYGRGSPGQVLWPPDGKTLVVASSIGVSILDPSSLKQTGFIDTGNWVSSIALSPDGSILATGSEDFTIKLWRTSDGSLLRILEGHSDAVSNLAFSQDGTILVSGSWNSGVKVWRIPDGQLLHSFSSGASPISLSPDGSILAVASNKNVELWRISDETLIRTFEGHTDRITCMEFSHDGKTLAAGSYDQTVILWNTSDGKILQTIKAVSSKDDPHPPLEMSSVAFSPNDTLLAAGSINDTVKLWDPIDGHLIREVDYSWSARSLAFSPDGASLASSSGYSINVNNVADGMVLHRDDDFMPGIDDITVFADGSSLLIGESNAAYFLKIAEKEVSSRKILEISVSSNIVITPDGTTLAAGSYDNNIHLYSLASGNIINTLVGHSASVEVLAVSSDGSLLASGSSNGILNVWRMKDGTLLNTFTISEFRNPVEDVAWSPDGKIIAGSGDEKIMLWSLSGNALLRHFESESGTPIPYSILYGFYGGSQHPISFSPDGLFFSSGWMDGTVRTWGMTNGDLLRTMAGHSSGISRLVYSPDGKILASGSADHTIRFWRASDGALLCILKGHTGTITGLAFLPDGSQLISSSTDGTIRFWGIASAAE